MKYRKKYLIDEPPVYEAGMEDGIEYYCRRFDVVSFIDTMCERCSATKRCNSSSLEKRPYVNTLNGKVYLKPDDRIAIGPQGEKYPIDERVFRDTYEAVDDSEIERIELLEDAAREYFAAYDEWMANISEWRRTDDLESALMCQEKVDKAREKLRKLVDK